MTKQSLIKLLKSGNFTIIYWDNNTPTIYKGKWDLRKEYERDAYETMDKNEIDYPLYDSNGYCPEIIELLVGVLGGKCNSI